MPTFLDHNNVNAIVIATPRFWFAEGATSAALAGTPGYGFRDIGNVNKSSMKTEVDRKEILGSYRGVRRLDKSIVTKSKLSFELDSHELNKENLAIALLASAGTGHTQSAQTAADADALVFSAGTPSNSGQWYDIKKSGARIRALTVCTVATLTEGTDFEVDYLLGRIRFITSRTASVTPVITAPAITSSDQSYFHGLIPLSNLTRTGYGRITMFDQNTQNGVAADYLDFSCQVTADGALDFDGENESMLKITVDVTSDVGLFLARFNLA